VTPYIDFDESENISFGEIYDLAMYNEWSHTPLTLADKSCEDNSDRKISWKLTTDFDKQRHLFFEKIETGYIIQSYICSCGYNHFIVKHSSQSISYRCKKCRNTNFYDAHDADRDIFSFLANNSDIKINYRYDLKQSHKEIISKQYITIPKDINFLKKEVIFREKTLYALSLNFDGKLEEIYHLDYDERIFERLKSDITHYINSTNCCNLPQHADKKMTMDMIIFFLKNRHLKEFEFYYWSETWRLCDRDFTVNDALLHIANYPKEKSIKRALYNNYNYQLENNMRFISIFIDAFTHSIEDINIIVKLIELHGFYDDGEYSITSDQLGNFIEFLKRYYSEKQILLCFSKMMEDFDKELFEDTLKMLQLNYNSSIQRYFR
jgi:hypothetical protein